jgi:CHRD domain
VQVTLFSGSTDRRLILQAARLDISETLAAAICANPAGYYVNYHTTDFPGGAVRGQLNEL